MQNLRLETNLSNKLPLLKMPEHQKKSISNKLDTPVARNLKELLAYQSNEIKKLRRRVDYLENTLRFQRISNQALEEDFQHVVNLLAKRGDV